MGINRWGHSSCWQPPITLSLSLSLSTYSLHQRLTRTLSMPLTVLTWNVWFDSLAAPQRFRAIAEEVLKQAPDVACFQEVTERFLRALHESEVRLLYEFSPNRIR